MMMINDDDWWLNVEQDYLLKQMREVGSGVWMGGAVVERMESLRGPVGRMENGNERAQTDTDCLCCSNKQENKWNVASIL